MELSESVERALAHAENRANQSAQRASESLAAKMGVIQGLRTFPAVAQKAVTLLADPEFKVGDVTKVVKEDPSLTAGVIRLANSAFFSRGREVDNVDRAVVRLGRGSVREVVCAVATMELFSDTSGYGGYVRNHSGSTAAIAQELMRDLAPALLDGAYLCGLMHDVGKLLLMASGEHIYTDPCGEELTTPDTCHLIERGELGYDHAALGGQVLWHWKFPEPVPQVVAWHHSPELARTEKEAGMLTSVLRLADRIEPSIGAEDADREKVAEALAEGGDGAFASVSADYIVEKWDRLIELKDEALKLFG